MLPFDVWYCITYKDVECKHMSKHYDAIHNITILLSQAGVNASSEQVLEWLVRADTASAFNISLGDVSVTGVQQVLCPVSAAQFRLVMRNY